MNREYFKVIITMGVPGQRLRNHEIMIDIKASEIISFGTGGSQTL